MSSLDIPRRAALLGLVALAGCGFVPAYAPGGAGTALSGRVVVAAPESVLDYRARVRLEQRLGAPQAGAPFALDLATQSRAVAAAVAADGVQTRLNLVGQASWRLTEPASGRLLGQGQVDAFAGFAATGSTVATRTAQADAEQRLGVMLADLVMTALLALPPASLSAP
jgi:LPS-assembly lipoprotein